MPYTLIFKEQFDESFSKIKDNAAKEQIWKKIQQLKESMITKTCDRWSAIS